MINSGNIPHHLSGNAIRQTFIDYFVNNHGHTFVPSSSLVPGGDSTLLFTNAGMVQFKDVFLGTDRRPYIRAVNSQKCMRVAGKHNDLDDVGRDDTHHTFFEMLGNWSFGDYYKKEAISWAWELLTETWGLPQEQLYATVFKDELGEIPTDHEAVEYWSQQPGFNPDRIFYFGRKDNFWEMADTGPCGPNSEIHIDLHPEDGPVHPEMLDTERFVELWNLVFIQYNRSSSVDLDPLPAKHVDTGMGFERIVAVLQGVGSNYHTDLLFPLIITTQKLAKQSDQMRQANFTPYRVIADHARAAAFLIADGVVPGNLGRNYVTRMIIRRAYRFASQIGLTEPFLAKIADQVIQDYGDAYPELVRNRTTIESAITREEEQFQRTLDRATSQLKTLLVDLKSKGEKVLSGEEAADLYTTHGMPFEITRDITREQDLDVDETGFIHAMDEHRQASGAGLSLEESGAEDTKLFTAIMDRLQNDGKINSEGVSYLPYSTLEVEAPVLALVSDSQSVDSAEPGNRVDVLLPKTCFYVEAGGQVSDTGTIKGKDWEIQVEEMRKPAAGAVVHHGTVLRGNPKVGDIAVARVDHQRRVDIMRNHTATHLLHAALHQVLGEHARQAGSLVAPDRLRFDFNHSQALTSSQIERIEDFVNEKILENHDLDITFKPLKQAKDEGVIALFGEKYGETVRTIRIGDFSYELCGGTHMRETGGIGTFLITSESSAAAGIRRLEAVTGREAYYLIRKRFNILEKTAAHLNGTLENVPEKVESTLEQLYDANKELASLRARLATAELTEKLDDVPRVSGIPVLAAQLPGADNNTLRQMADRFRQHYSSGVAVLSSVQNGNPILIATVTEDLVKRGLHAGELVKSLAKKLGGGGGGSAEMAQAGGKDASKLDEVLNEVPNWVKEHLTES